MYGYKGFNDDFTCKDMQYEVGKTYTHDGEIDLCKSGYHFCLKPIDVIDYYAPFNHGFTRYGYVQGEDDSDNNICKVVVRQLTVIKELPIVEFAQACLDNMTQSSYANNDDEYYYGFNSVRGMSVNYSNYGGAVTWANNSISTSMGRSSIAMAHGINSCAVSTDYDSITVAKEANSVSVATASCSVAICERYASVAATTFFQTGSETFGIRSIAACSDSCCAARTSGNESVAVTTGKGSEARIEGGRSVAVVLGDNSECVSEGHGLLVCAGKHSKAKGKVGDFIVRVKWDGDTIADVTVNKIDGENYKPDTWYETD